MTGAAPEVPESGHEPRPEDVAEAIRAGRAPSELLDDPQAGTETTEPPPEGAGGAPGTDSRGSL